MSQIKTWVNITVLNIINQIKKAWIMITQAFMKGTKTNVHKL